MPFPTPVVPPCLWGENDFDVGFYNFAPQRIERNMLLLIPLTHQSVEEVTYVGPVIAFESYLMTLQVALNFHFY